MWGFLWSNHYIFKPVSFFEVFPVADDNESEHFYRQHSLRHILYCHYALLFYLYTRRVEVPLITEGLGLIRIMRKGRKPIYPIQSVLVYEDI